MPWKRELGWRGLAALYISVAVILAGVYAATSSPGLQFVVLIALILVSPARSSGSALQRREPWSVVVGYIAVFGVIAIGLSVATSAVESALAVSLGLSFTIWIAAVPATVAAGETAKRVKRSAMS